MRPYIKTYSVCVGNQACNAKCPFCVARMTGTAGVKPGASACLDSFRLKRGAELAKSLGATTVLITGKGEPTLWPDRLYDVLMELRGIMPLMEVQTNGIALTDEMLDKMYGYGVTMVALSAVHCDNDANKKCYGENYPGLERLIEMVHTKHMSVRICCMLCKGWIDTVGGVERMIRLANGYDVEQLTIRSVQVPSQPSCRNPEVYRWAEEHKLSQEQVHEIEWHIHERSTRLNTLVHGHVYAYPLEGDKEQNVCVSDCLTRDPDSNEIRQLIYCPDGHVRYDWEHDAAIVF